MSKSITLKYRQGNDTWETHDKNGHLFFIARQTLKVENSELMANLLSNELDFPFNEASIDQLSEIPVGEGIRFWDEN